MTRDELLGLMGDLDRGSNLFGGLAASIRARLFAVVEGPTQETWGDAYSIILSAARFTTLWQALLRHTDYDVTRGPSTDGETRGSWTRVPTSEQLLTAIRMEITGGDADSHYETFRKGQS